MKKSFVTKFSYFLSLLFLAMIAPIFISSDAHAACAVVAAVAPTGTPGQSGYNPGTPARCSGADAGFTCAPVTDNTGIVISCTQVKANVTDASNVQYDKNAFVTTICNALKVITGNGGKAFAAFAIISLGIGFFTGKVSWGLMIGVAAGIAAMFGAPTIVAAISGTDTFNCSAGSTEKTVN